MPTPPPAPTPVPTPESSNPYAAAAKDTGFDGAPRERTGRNFRFNPKGKYIALANQIRQENQLEALKQRIAESARKAGLDGEMGVEKNIKVRSSCDDLLHVSYISPSELLLQRRNGGMRRCYRTKTTTIFLSGWTGFISRRLILPLRYISSIPSPFPHLVRKIRWR